MAEQESSDFELVPFRQIEELREELSKLKETPLPAPKKLELSLEEVSAKLDRLIGIFEEATHMMRVEEGGLKLSDHLRTLSSKIEQVAEQNKEIAQALVTVADMVSESKEKGGSSSSAFQGPSGQGKQALPPLFPPGPAGFVPPPPPLPPKKGFFK